MKPSKNKCFIYYLISIIFILFLIIIFLWLIYRINNMPIIWQPQILEDGSLVEFKEVNNQIIKTICSADGQQIKEYDLDTNQLIKIIDFQDEITEYVKNNGQLNCILTSFLKTYQENLIIQEIWPNKKIIYSYDNQEPLITNLLGNIILRYEPKNNPSQTLLTISIQNNTHIEYDYTTGNISRIFWPNGIISQYHPQNSLLTQEILPNQTKREYHYDAQKIDNLRNRQKVISSPFLTEITPDGITKKYQLYLNQELLPNGIIRTYHSNFFTDISPIDNILKEYDINTKKLMQVVFPNGLIKKYSLFNGHLKQEIFPNRMIKEYNPFQDTLLEEIMPDGTKKKYDEETHILSQIIQSNGVKTEIKKENDVVNSHIVKIFLPDKTIIEFDQEKKVIQKEITPQGIVKNTIFEYEPKTQKLVRIRLPNDHIKEFHPSTGKLIKEIFADGLIKEYDENTTLLIKEILPNGMYICYEYLPKTDLLLRSVYSDGFTIEHDLNEVNN
ncbi:hypothetical protein C6B37_00255 [Candidatus Phytoplasma phoenicium]|uniref:DUF2963 domain-containing protein n=1 Tax=Candidatus Phytoplasma phoenicium TaxID=198422 RepID=A0A2S8NV97_9MOLU|nr:hypothetical protein C6B37_00255 [Candidatus Phytoplasma phoenicium]